MTSKLERQFFDTFGIKVKSISKGCTLGAKYYSEICKEKTCKGCDCEIRETYYPKITDRILLELICILSESPISISFDALILGASDVEKLKGYILLACMGFDKDIKQQVRTLFGNEKEE